MKKIILILQVIILMFLFSCDKENGEIFNDVSFQLGDKILDKYFVTTIAFDSRGTAWIGTFNQGLIKYDDGKITVFNHKNSIIDSSFISEIVIDKNDNVWIGANALIKYDGKLFTKYDKTNSIMPENFVSCLAVDKNNEIWFSSSRFRQGGLMKFDGRRFELFTPENSKLPCNFISDIIIDKEYNKWIALGETVNEVSMVKVKDNSWTLINSSSFGFNPYYWGDLDVNSDNSLIATINYGLSSLWDIKRPNILMCKNGKWIINNPSDMGGNSLGYVRTICCDNKGYIWAALSASPENKNLAVYNGQKWSVNNDNLETADIFVMKADKENNIWLGTGSGIQIIKTID